MKISKLYFFLLIFLVILSVDDRLKGGLKKILTIFAQKCGEIVNKFYKKSDGSVRKFTLEYYFCRLNLGLNLGFDVVD